MIAHDAKPARQKPACSGFTLVEVLASLVLIAIVMPAALRGVSVALSLASNARQRSVAAMLAEGKMWELVATGEALNGDQEGDFEPDWPQYRWASELADWEVAPLKILTVRVEWPWRGQTRQVTLTTLLYPGKS